MTVHLDWPREAVDRFTDEARQKGLSLDTYVLQTVLQHQTAIDTGSFDEAGKGQAREEAGPRIRELRKGNILGPGLNIQDLIEEGRRF